MNLGPAEIMVILLIGLLVFGPSRLPELSRQVGSAMRQLKQMQSSLKREIDEALQDDSDKPMTRRGTPAPVVDAEPDHTDLPAPDIDPRATGAADTADADTNAAGAGPEPQKTPTDPFTGPGDSFI